MITDGAGVLEMMVHLVTRVSTETQKTALAAFVHNLTADTPTVNPELRLSTFVTFVPLHVCFNDAYILVFRLVKLFNGAHNAARFPVILGVLAIAPLTRAVDDVISQVVLRQCCETGCSTDVDYQRLIVGHGLESLTSRYSDAVSCDLQVVDRYQACV